MPEVYVHAVKGRTLEQKRALIKDITDAVVRNFSAPIDAVTVTIVEADPTTKAKGGVLFSERAPGASRARDRCTVADGGRYGRLVGAEQVEIAAQHGIELAAAPAAVAAAHQRRGLAAIAAHDRALRRPSRRMP